MNGLSSEIVFSTRLERVICRRSHPTHQPDASPIAMPPAPVNRSSAPARGRENVPDTTAASAIWYATSAAASFTRLSPSRITSISRGSFNRRVLAITATASGGDTIAPNTKQAANGSPGSNACVVRATTPIVASTSATARRVMARRLRFKSRSDVLTEAQNSSGGMKTRKMVSGSSPRRGSPGVSAMPKPPRTSSVGKGMPVRSASKRNPATRANNKSISVRADNPAAYGEEAKTRIRITETGSAQPCRNSARSAR
jgi:hypothetical protein